MCAASSLLNMHTGSTQAQYQISLPSDFGDIANHRHISQETHQPGSHTVLTLNKLLAGHLVDGNHW